MFLELITFFFTLLGFTFKMWSKSLWANFVVIYAWVKQITAVKFCACHGRCLCKSPNKSLYMFNAILHIIITFHLKNKNADEKNDYSLWLDKSFIMYRVNITGKHTAWLPCLSSCLVGIKRLFLSCFFASGAFLFDYQLILTVVSMQYGSWKSKLRNLTDGRYV